ncbi:UDP-N-acetylmuramate dehydrogenase [Gammaproteobacteria bacterium AB-CW1]|uniref:UDP-N-acetylenolpyruvoylglucosamine reductase n=1 Tax=Natronospira elongata TaxID=3110268 RepID=A0AAP6JF02_9GAMM|nr:UDP-N-acetylmuramate dehydrogenase [Gammaproteobacteria bacterium AB-CW1]
MRGDCMVSRQTQDGDKGTGLEVCRDAELSALNTLAVPVRATRLLRVSDPRLFEAQPPRDGDLVLGGGSNVLFRADFPGSIWLMVNRGIEGVSREENGDLIRVAAGENWDAFVRWSLEQGYHGLENLILIPGSVGAAPIQNIGAYGVEVERFIRSVTVWDRRARQFREFSHPECAFDYRDSRFKRERDAFVVTHVNFHLPCSGEPALEYAGVREELAAMGIDRPEPRAVARAVEAIRRRKLPDPARLSNAGSFFKNPVVSAARAAALQADHAALPVFPLPDGGCKLSAAWLLEQCGLKGWRRGAAGFAEQHALVLVNHGGATGAELWAAAQEAMARVEAEFGLRLEPEPRIV